MSQNSCPYKKVKALNFMLLQYYPSYVGVNASNSVKIEGHIENLIPYLSENALNACLFKSWISIGG